MSAEAGAVDGPADSRLSPRQPFKVELIKFVRGHPELWDTSKSAYRNNTLKSSVWDKFLILHPGLTSKQVRETWRLIKNRFYAEKEFRQNASNMGKDIPGDFPYYDDCAFLEGGKPEVHNFGTRSQSKYADESKDFLEDFRRVLNEAGLDEVQSSPQSENDMENSAPRSHSNFSQSSERGPAETRAQLIDLVRDLPELYDKSNPLYKNNAHKGTLWSSIAKKLGNGATAKKVREQWSYMRRKYEEEFFSRKAGQAPTPMDPSKRHLFTFDQLAFLEAYMSSERPESPPEAEVSENDAEVADGVHSTQDPFGLRGSANFNELLWQLTSGKNGAANGSGAGANGARVNPDTGEILFEERPAPSTTNSTAEAAEGGRGGPARPAKKRRLEEAALGGAAAAEAPARSADGLLRSVVHLSRCLAEVLPGRHEDECALFGKQVAVDLRALSPRSRLAARKRINDVLIDILMQDQRGAPPDSPDAELVGLPFGAGQA